MITNILIGILLGFLLFKLGELIIRKIYKSRFIEARFNKTLLNKKKLVKNKIEPLM